MTFFYFTTHISLTDLFNEDFLAEILGMLFTTVFMHYCRERIVKLLKRVLGNNYKLKACICFIIFICFSVFLIYKIPDRPSQEAVKAQQKKIKDEKDFLEKLKWAKEGNPVFQDIVGYMYYEGHVVAKNYAEAVFWFKKSAEKSYDQGIYDLAFMYYNGYGVSQDYRQAADLYKRASELVIPMPAAQYNLGNMYFAGEGVEKNISKALKLYETAANSRYFNASKKLGNIYFYGTEVKQDYGKAIYWYSKAADEGKDSELMYLIGNLYYEGKVVKQNYKKAYEWYSKSTNLGYIPAMQNLANMYYHGQGVPIDYQKAFYWHKEVAMSGFVKIREQSMLIIGNMYSYGHGVEQDYQEALKWYKRASIPIAPIEVQREAKARISKLEEKLQIGNNKRKAEEHYTLANKFFAEKDYRKAAQLYELAAELGNIDAKKKLDHIYSKGLVDRKRKTSITKSFNASIVGSNVNIRIQPNTSSRVIKQLNTGHPVNVNSTSKGKGGDWYFIETASGTQGWVFGKYLKIK